MTCENSFIQSLSQCRTPHPNVSGYVTAFLSVRLLDDVKLTSILRTSWVGWLIFSDDSDSLTGSTTLESPVCSFSVSFSWTDIPLALLTALFRDSSLESSVCCFSASFSWTDIPLVLLTALSRDSFDSWTSCYRRCIQSYISLHVQQLLQWITFVVSFISFPTMAGVGAGSWLVVVVLSCAVSFDLEFSSLFSSFLSWSKTIICCEGCMIYSDQAIPQIRQIPLVVQPQTSMAFFSMIMMILPLGPVESLYLPPFSSLHAFWGPPISTE